VKLIWNEKVYGWWNVTGLIGKNTNWFFGFSRKPTGPAAPIHPTADPRGTPTWEDQNCREAQMVVIERDASGKPTVWCDPEIADLIRALNTGGVRTIASCSGHGEKPGWIALKDGRQLAIVPDLDSFKRLIGAGTNGVPAGSDAGIPASPVGVNLPDGSKR
jgi:hypothetical protein